MASVNYMKCKGAGHAKAIMRHSEEEERLKHEHSNPHLDKSCTENNSSLFGLTYVEMCRKYDQRIRTLDETTNRNKRSDRVTMFSLEYTVPEGLPAWQEESYLADVEKLIADQYGTRNIIESERHFDEKHTYIDHGEEKTSRAHGHTFVVPEVDGQLNGKKFSSKSQMMTLNKSIEVMSMEKYHIHFMTGKEARHKTVEALKNESLIEEQERTLNANRGHIEALKEESQALKDDIQTLKDDKEDLQAQYEADRERLNNELAEKKKLIEKQERAIEGRQLKIDEIRALNQKTFWTQEDKNNVLKTALSSAKNAQKAKEADSLKKEVEQMKPTYDDYSRVEAQVKQRDNTISKLTNQLATAREEVRVRDEFIQKHGIKERFIDFCKSIGHRVKDSVQEHSWERSR